MNTINKQADKRTWTTQMHTCTIHCAQCWQIYR